MHTHSLTEYTQTHTHTLTQTHIFAHSYTLTEYAQTLYTHYTHTHRIHTTYIHIYTLIYTCTHTLNNQINKCSISTGLKISYCTVETSFTLTTRNLVASGLSETMEGALTHLFFTNLESQFSRKCRLLQASH